MANGSKCTQEKFHPSRRSVDGRLRKVFGVTSKMQRRANLANLSDITINALDPTKETSVISVPEFSFGMTWVVSRSSGI